MIDHAPNNRQPINYLLQRFHQLWPRRFHVSFQILQFTFLSKPNKIAIKQTSPKNPNQPRPISRTPTENPKMMKSIELVIITSSPRRARIPGRTCLGSTTSKGGKSKFCRRGLSWTTSLGEEAAMKVEEEA